MSNEEKKVDTKKETKTSTKSKRTSTETKKSSAKKVTAKKSNVGKTKKTDSVKSDIVKEEKNTKSNAAINLEEADSFYHVSLLAQATCVIGILAISILAIFENSFTVPIEVLVGITLLIMAYNNSKLFKRKGLTRIYVVFGIISLVVGILGYFGVTL